jgi:hypothetical protein
MVQTELQTVVAVAVVLQAAVQVLAATAVAAKS